MPMSLVDRLSLSPGDIVHVRARLIEDHGDDLFVEMIGPNATTRVYIGKRELVGCEKRERDDADDRRKIGLSGIRLRVARA